MQVQILLWPLKVKSIVKKDYEFINTIANLFLTENLVFIAFTCDYTRSVSRPSAIYLNHIKISKKRFSPYIAGFLKNKGLTPSRKYVWPKMLDDITECVIEKTKSSQIKWLLEKQNEVRKGTIYSSNLFFHE